MLIQLHNNEELKLEKFLTDNKTMSKIKITQIKSVIDRSERQKLTMKALGLKKISQSVEVEANDAIIGMVRSINHLVAVENI